MYSKKLESTHVLENDIKVKSDVVIKSLPHQLCPIKLEAMDKEVEKLLKEGVISESISPYSSPAFLVPKKENKFRLLVDYRRIN